MTRATAGSAAIISVRGLRKSFKGRRGKGPVEAVRGIELSVSEGEVFGFLGPNGAGKSTTLRILSTLLPADDGEVSIAGFDVRTRPREVRKQIGYVGQAGGADPLATGRENLRLQARLYGLGGVAADRRAGGAHPVTGSRRVRRPIRKNLLRRAEAEAGYRHRHGAQPEDPFSRRTDNRAGPGEPLPALGADPCCSGSSAPPFFSRRITWKRPTPCATVSRSWITGRSSRREPRRS